MSEDVELLNRYATDDSEAAFTELVRRHVDFVYSAALRLLHGEDLLCHILRTMNVAVEIGRAHV